MQKFNESKQANATVAEKEERPTETTEVKKDNHGGHDKDASADSRPNPAGESHGSEQDTSKPVAQDSGMYWSSVLF